MDFFEAQARAKKRTSRLVILFGFAVAGTIAAAYLGGVFGWRFLEEQRGQQRGRYAYEQRISPRSWWQPKIFLGVTFGTLAVVGIASLFKWKQFSSGGSAVAESVGGRRVEPHTKDLNERKLLNVVEEMAIASGTPVPAVYVLDDEAAINAFAAGLTTHDAVVAVTRGTLQKLTRDELQGVVGHEFSHILNGDMRLNLRLTALLFGILVLGLAGRGILWSLRGARVSSRRDKNSGGVVAAIVVVGLALVIIGYVGYFFGRIIQAAVSRQREFLADASAVQFTRNPGGLTGALKKIGGYALGSSLQTSKAAAIGHFFFAQSFRKGITGLWATHPPLGERIRAIEPQFDGQMFSPPEVVDVERESFLTAGFAPPPPPAPKRALAPFDPQTALANSGTVTPEQFADAGALLATIPQSLREAAHLPDQAPALLYGLLLSHEPATRQQQLALIKQHGGEQALSTVEKLSPALSQIGPEHKYPLVQLAVPAIKNSAPDTLSTVLGTLDELVHADRSVSPLEFALQKVLTRALALGRSPKSAVVEIYSFNALTSEISVVLSALAQAATVDSTEAQFAFTAGASQIRLVQSQLVFNPQRFDFAALDSALDRLAKASGPIKQRTLLAAAHVVSANGSVSVAEAELLRAVSAALDVPLPPMGSNRSR